MLSILRIVAALAALVLSASAAAAQSVRLVVGYPAGGGVDAVARLIAKKLSESPDRSFLVDNRSGASGLIGAGHIAKSAPDGKQFLVASPAEIVVSQAAGQKLPYSPSRDLVPVILIGDDMEIARQCGVRCAAFFTMAFVTDLLVAQLRALLETPSDGTPAIK